MSTLYLDTSSTPLRIGLYEEGRWHWQAPTVDNTGPMLRAEHVVPLVSQLLTAQGKTPGELARLVVMTGPGSFTGLRIGVACARSWAQAMPGLSILALDHFRLVAAMAHEAGVLHDGHGATVVLDAWRPGRVYAASLDADFSFRQPARLVTYPADAPDGLKLALSVHDKDLLLADEGLLEQLPKATAISTLAAAFEAALTRCMSANRLELPWQQLEPLYLQPPAITQTKKQPVSG